MSLVANVSSQEFRASVLDAPGLTLVDFHSPASLACERFARSLEQLAFVYAGAVRFVRVDADANPESARCSRARASDVLLFENGSDIDRTTRTMDELESFAAVEALLDRHVPGRLLQDDCGDGSCQI